MAPLTAKTVMLQGIVALVLASLVNVVILGAEPKAGETHASTQSLLAGNGLLAREMYEPAVAEYRTYLSKHGEHEKAAEARYGLAVCLFRLGRFEEALKELESLQAAPGFAYAAEVAAIEGQCLLALGRFAEAAEAFDGLLRRFADHLLAGDAAVGAVEALYRAGKYDESSARCRDLLSKNPTDAQRERAEFFWAISDLARGQVEAATERLANFTKAFPTSAFSEQAMLCLAQGYQRIDKPDKAIRQYRTMLKRPGGALTAEASFGLCALLNQTGKHEEASAVLDEFGEALSSSTLASKAMMLRAKVRFAQGDYDRAFEAFQKAGEMDGDAAGEVAFWSAKCDLRRGAFAAAANRLDSAIKRFTGHSLIAEMSFDLAVALHRNGETNKAVEALETFVSSFGDHALAPEAYQLLAMTEHQKGNYEKSSKHAKMLLSGHPESVGSAIAAFLVAENAFLAGDFAKAVEGYRELIAWFPSSAELDKARFRLGTALYRLNRFDEAKAVLEQVEALAGRDELFRSALLILGDIDFQRSEWKQAVGRLARYLEVGGESPASADDALMKLAYARQRMGHSKEALRNYGQLIERFPDSTHGVQARFEQGQILVALNQLDEAKIALEQVLNTTVPSRFASSALNHLASIALKQGDSQKAAGYYEQAVGVSTGDDEIAAICRQGQALMVSGQFADAETAFRRVVDVNAESSVAKEALARLAVAQSRQERFSDALATIERVEAVSDGIRALEPSLRGVIRYEKAWCLRAMNKPADAVNAYRALLADSEAGSVRFHAMLELAELEAAADRHEQAAEVLRKLKNELSGEDKAKAELVEPCLYRLAVSEFRQDHFELAAGVFDELIDGFPKSVLLASACYYAGESLANLGRNEKAVERFSRAANEFPDDPVAGPAILRLGDCHATLQRWALSEEAYKKYLDRFSGADQWFAAQFGIGWAQENQGRFDSAIESYRKVVERHQGATAARAQFQIGQCLFAEKKLEPAVRELLKVDILFAYPEWSAAALYEAGRCFAQLGDTVQAKKQFSTVAEKYSDTQWAKLAAKQISELASSVATLPGK